MIYHRGCVVFTNESMAMGRTLRTMNARPSAEYHQWVSRLWRACCNIEKQRGGEVPERQPETTTEWPAAIRTHIKAASFKVGPAPESVVLPGGEEESFVWVPRYTPGVPPGALPEAPDAEVLVPTGFELRDYQSDAVAAWIRAGRAGVVKIPTGGGKTETGIAAIARTPTTALVLVPTVELFNQWQGRLAKYLPGVEVGIAGDGRLKNWQTCRVGVAIVQTLAMWSQADRKALLARFGLVIDDEAHHCPAAVHALIVAACPGPYRLLLSATPYRADGLTDWIFWTGGPLVYEVAQSVLEDLGNVLAPVVRMPHTHWDLPPELDGADWSTIFSGTKPVKRREKVGGKWKMVATGTEVVSKNAVCVNPDRNAKLVGWMLEEVNEGRRVFGVTSRVEHAALLARLLNEAGGGGIAEVVTGGTAKGKRRDIMARVVAGEVKALVGTVGKEGFDAPALDTVVFLVPFNSKAKGDILQYVGRALRPAEGKEARLIDPRDAWKPFQGWANGRRAIYRKMGWMER